MTRIAGRAILAAAALFVLAAVATLVAAPVAGDIAP